MSPLPIAVLAPSPLLANLREALTALGWDPVLVWDPTRGPAPLPDPLPRAALVVLDPLIEEHLEPFEALLYHPNTETLFDEADGRHTWNGSRWGHHLHAKLFALEQRAKTSSLSPDGPAEEAAHTLGVTESNWAAEAAIALESPECPEEVSGKLALTPEEHISPDLSEGWDGDAPLGGMIFFDEEPSAFPDHQERLDLGASASAAPSNPEQTGPLVLELLADVVTSVSSPIPVPSVHAPQAPASWSLMSLTENEPEVQEEPQSAPGASGELVSHDVLSPRSSFTENEGIVVIAAGAGGPAGLRALLPHLKPWLAIPVAIHHPLAPASLETLAANLSKKTGLAATVPNVGQRLTPGKAWLLPEGMAAAPDADGWVVAQGHWHDTLALAADRRLAVVILSGVEADAFFPVMEAASHGALVLGAQPEHTFAPGPIPALLDVGMVAAEPEVLAAHLAEHWGLASS